jgi:thiamine monophosphate kinase
VNGTVNDLAMSGARPLHLSAGFILEEGFAIADLRRIAASMAQAAAAAGVSIVTGDTKVVDAERATAASSPRRASACSSDRRDSAPRTRGPVTRCSCRVRSRSTA